MLESVTMKVAPVPGTVPMQIERTRHVDASEHDESDGYDYYYEYDLYCFTEGTVSLTARSYVDEPHEAHFLGVEEHGRPRTLVDADLKTALFQSARSHLRSEGKTNLRWLSGRGDGYEPVPPGP